DELFGRTDTMTGVSIEYLTDQLGSTVALSDSNRSTIATYSYEPYGRSSLAGVDHGSSRTFTGREDEDDDLKFYRARFYSSSTGRFISEDPLGLRAGDSNLYRYVFDNPVNLADPTGLHHKCSDLEIIFKRWDPGASNPSKGLY